MINRLVSGIRDGVFQLRGTVKVNTSTKWNLARCINTTDLFKVKKLLASLQNKRFCIFMYLSVSILCHHFKYLLKKILLKKMARKNASRLDSSDRLSPHKDLFFCQSVLCTQSKYMFSRKSGPRCLCFPSSQRRSQQCLLVHRNVFLRHRRSRQTSTDQVVEQFKAFKTWALCLVSLTSE